MRDPRLVLGPWATLTAADTERFDALVAAMDAPGLYGLPSVVDLPVAVVARWLYRRWAPEAEPRPLVGLDPAHLHAPGEPAGRAGERLRAVFAQARDGVLWLEGAEPPGDLGALAAEHRVRVLRPGGPPVELLPSVAGWALAVDRLHAVAVDPSLDALRAGLLDLCEAAAVVELWGPPGSGRRSLAAWAHCASGATAPLVPVRAGEDPPAESGWLLYENREALDPPLRTFLRRRLEERAPRLAPPPAPVGGVPPARPVGPAFDEWVGDGPATRRLLQLVRARAPVRSDDPRGGSVLLTGETGAGKGVVARMLHAASGRRGRFVTVDLGSLPRELVAAELFGTDPGAFTGAVPREGLLERARGGTLFLDEVGDLPREVQQMLLTVLQDRVARRVGGKEPYAVDVRIVSATARNLVAAVERGDFRADLLHRLGGGATAIRVPPLRERAEDLPALCAHRLRGHALTDAAVRVLRSERWPGNVRQLENVLAVAEATAGTAPIGPEHLSVGVPAPLLLTSLTPSRGEDDLGARVSPFSVAVPGPRERGAALRALVLSAVAPRPVDPDALAWLTARQWPDGLREAEARLPVLAAGPPGPVTLDRVRRLVPGTIALRKPLVVVAMPAVDADGRVEGLERAFDEEGVLIGRAPQGLVAAWSARRTPGAAPPPGMDAVEWGRLSWVRERVGATPPGVLPWTVSARLSAAHVLIRRAGDGLWVGRLPETHLSLFVLDLQGGRERQVPAGGAVEVGPAARAQVRHANHGLLLDVVVFHGLDAREEPYVLDADDQVPGRTELGDAPLPPPVAAGAPPPPTRAWLCDEAERAAVLGVVGVFLDRGGVSLSEAVATSVAGWRASGVSPRLVAHLDRSEPSHRNTALQRLVVARVNRELAEEVGALVRARVERGSPELVHNLPLWLRTLANPDRPAFDEEGS